ncbi:nose resistant to fluoxetine protein 6 [Anabrus simplex]|uniref:nose resistant to fluoxetine protein 6 n=1 Tax=Anabrus simplex TaxID=316456 RepID=UPI0035A32A2C
MIKRRDSNTQTSNKSYSNTIADNGPSNTRYKCLDASQILDWLESGDVSDVDDFPSEEDVIHHDKNIRSSLRTGADYKQKTQHLSSDEGREGTCRINRFASPPVISDSDAKKKGRGHRDQLVSNDDVVMAMWMDNSSVVLTSSFVGIGTEDTVLRCDPKIINYVDLTRTEIVKLYNHGMGRVDLVDQLISLYRINIRSRKWTLGMFFHAVDLVLCISWIEYRRDSELSGVPKKQVMDLLHFRMLVAESLLKVGKAVYTKKRVRRSLEQEVESAPTQRRRGEIRPKVEVQKNLTDHMPQHNKQKEAGRCVIDSFLSWAWFQPLSRLSYSMYLFHFSVQVTQMSSLRTLSYLSDDSLVRKGTILETHPTLEKITLPYVLPGHSFLPNDSNFGDIECALKLQQQLYTVNDYMNVMKVRRRKKALAVHRMEQKEFFGTQMLEKQITNLYDASAKFPESVLMGALTHPGNFDECIAVRDVKALDGSTFHGQHCVAIAVIIPKMPSNEATGAMQTPALNLGTCVPSTCDVDDAALIVKEDFKKRLTTVSPLFNSTDIYITVPESLCQTKMELELDSKDWATTIILVVVAVLVVLSTAYDIVTLNSESRINLLLAFSVYTNGSKLFAISTSRSGNTITCLHGIRFLSMAWVILGHRYRSAINFPSINSSRYGEEIYSDWRYLWITNATISVDTFLVLSGLLVAYTFLQKVPKTNSFNVPMYYIHRYIRLTPSLAMIVLLQVSLLRHAGTGPFWNNIHDLGDKCQHNWWITLLYLQNYIEVAKQCIDQAWYLSMDMQLFWLSPLVLIPLWKWPKKGLYFTGALAIAGIVSNFVISYVNEFSGTTVGPNVRNGVDFGKLMYVATHARFVPYLLGVFLGYFLVYLKSRKTTIKFPKMVTLLLWVAAGVLLPLTLCIVNVFRQPGYEFNNFSAALYNSLGRPGWGLGIAMVIFLCHTGHGGVIDSFLSWPWFQPLSRLSYSIYLIHMAVQMNKLYSQRTLVYLSDDNIMREYFGDLVISLLLGIVLTLTFESPFIVLENELLGGRNKKTVGRNEVAAVAGTSQTNAEQAQEDEPEEQSKEILKV